MGYDDTLSSVMSPAGAVTPRQRAMTGRDVPDATLLVNDREPAAGDCVAAAHATQRRRSVSAR